VFEFIVAISINLLFPYRVKKTGSKPYVNNAARQSLIASPCINTVAGDKNFLWQNIMSIKILKITARYDIPAPAIRIGFVLSPPKNNTNGKPSG
jgi:hypothetical protein